MTEQQLQIVATDILFYHNADEEAFIGWIDRMTFVREAYGLGRDMFLILNRFPTDDDLREIIGFCKRYGVGMSQLAKFETKENSVWMRDPEKFWCNEIFGILRNAKGS
jgi:hypothetical protein